MLLIAMKSQHLEAVQSLIKRQLSSFLLSSLTGYLLYFMLVLIDHLCMCVLTNLAGIATSSKFLKYDFEIENDISMLKLYVNFSIIVDYQYYNYSNIITTVILSNNGRCAFLKYM